MRLEPLLLPAGELVAGRWHNARLLRRTRTSCLYLGVPRTTAEQVVVLRFPAGRAPWDRADTALFAGRGLLGPAQRVQLEQHEAAVLGRLDHPRVIRAVSAGVHRHRPFIALEHFPGAPLGQLAWDPERRLAEIVEVFASVLDALAHVHERGVVHRDIKPSNVLARRLSDGSVDLRLVDFGLALLEEGGIMAGPPGRVGTTAYKAPERIAAERGGSAAVDGRSDLYALGVGLYEILAGALPFSDRGPALERAHFLAAPPPIEGIPPALAAVVDTLLAKDPEARYADGARAARALRASLDPDAPSVRVPAPEPWGQRLAWARQQREASPGDVDAHLWLARVAREVREVDVAVGAAEAAMVQVESDSAGPASAAAHRSAAIEQVRCLLAAGRTAQAVTALGRVVARHGPDPVCAELAWAAGDLDTAQDMAWQMLERAPAVGRRLWLTLARSALGALDQAAAEPLLWRALARGCAVLGMAEQAGVAAARARALAPLDAVTEASLGLVGQDGGAAWIGLRVALAHQRAAPESALARILLAEALCDTGEHTRAMVMLDGLESSPPEDGTAWSALARVSLRLGLYGPALEAATRACEATRPAVDAWGYRALALVHLGRREQAQAALARDPGSEAGRGAALLLAADASADVPATLASAVADGQVWDADVATAAALVLLRESGLTRSLDLAERAVVLAPERAASWLCLALAAERAGELGLAVDAAERALARAELEAARACLARCQERLGG